MLSEPQPAWARVTLVQGASRSDRWQVDSSSGCRGLLVGSRSRCDWLISADGVAPVHVGLYWNGERLWVADLDGGVCVDGEPVESWHPIIGPVRIEIGDAILLAETWAPMEEQDLALAPTVIAPLAVATPSRARVWGRAALRFVAASCAALLVVMFLNAL